MRALAAAAFAALAPLLPVAGTALDVWALEQRARSGDAQAALALALVYDGGDGVPADPARAYRWYLEAALAGNPSAQFNVAVFLDAGRAVPPDLEAAALWYGRAAAHGHARAAFNLALLYASGEGVPRNPALAASWNAAVQDTLPAARDRVRALRRIAADGAQPLDLTAPQPMMDVPFLVPRGAGWTVALVWRLPPQPPGARVLLDVARIDAAGPRRLVERFEDVSATLLELPGAAATYVWRVHAVDPSGARYAASPWRSFSVGERVPRGMPALEAALAQLPPPDAIAGFLPAVPADETLSVSVAVETATIEPLRVVIRPRRTSE